MPRLLQDTIVALSTAQGAGGRGIVRMSGPGTVGVLRAVFRSPEDLPPRANQLVEGMVELPGLEPRLPATLYYFGAPHSLTGQDVAELHTLSSPPLLELLVTGLLQAGCRAAQPGEFTQRAFLAGKCDLTRAEAVQAVIEANSRADLKQALTQLAGGLAQPLSALREELLNLLADVEAGLDFADEDLQFVEPKEMLLRLGNALAHVTLAGKQLESRALAGQTYRAVLAGRPNAGKSSLFNALAGTKALVSELPGTTRDYLVARVHVGGGTLELVDTPGWQEADERIEEQAQSLAHSQQVGADVLLLCVESGAELSSTELRLLQQEHPPVERIATKCDLGMAPLGWLATSTVQGTGLAELRQRLAARLVDRPEPALAPSVSRCQCHVKACLEHLRRAHAVVLEEGPPEILALGLREALEEVGAMVGAVYTDDLLDRVFSRFCIGK